MSETRKPSALSRLSGCIATALAIGVLYLAREILIPFSLALLFSFILAPVVSRLERLRLGRLAAVLLASLLASVISVGICAVVINQLVALTNSLPQYRQNIDEKISVLRGGSGALSRTTKDMRELAQELGMSSDSQAAPADAGRAGLEADRAAAQAPDGLVDPRHPSRLSLLSNTSHKNAPSTRPGSNATQPDAAAVAPSTQPRPVPVDVVPPPMSPFELLTNAIKPLLGVLMTVGVVVIFMIFMLIQREDLRSRFIQMIGGSHGNRVAQAIDEAAQRVSRYLISQLLTNAAYGLLVGVSLYGIGLPEAAFWGLVSGVLRFVPYLGIWIAAAGAALLSLAVFPGWTHLAIVSGLFIVLEIVVANFVEPWLYGKRTGISPFAVLLAAVFWTWLWGGVGLLLSTPITVCLVVVGTYIPQLRFLVVLFGESPDVGSPRHPRGARSAVGLK